MRESRDLRIGLSQTHVNPLKWLGMAFLGFLTLLSVAVVHADNARAALVGIVLFALAAAPTSAIVLIHGNPFQPPSAVSAAPIADALSPETLGSAAPDGDAGSGDGDVKPAGGASGSSGASPASAGWAKNPRRPIRSFTLTTTTPCRASGLAG